MPEQTKKDRALLHLLVAVGVLTVSAVVFFTPVPYWLFDAYYKILALGLLVESTHLVFMIGRSLASRRFRNAAYAILAIMVLALIPVAFFIALAGATA